MSDAEASSTRARHGAIAKALMVEPDLMWLARTAERTGIPLVALRAYGSATIL